MIFREILCRQISFVIEPVWTRIVSSDINRILVEDLYNFMRSNNLDCNLEEIKLFFADRGTSGNTFIDKFE